MSPATSVGHGPGSVRILVADADDDTRSFYRGSLGRAGCDVVDAENGPDALVQALGQRPALVITEVSLPVFDGYALCEVLRRDAMTRTVPILVVTSETRQAELERVRIAGADAVLIKPVAPQVLLSEIRRLLGRAAKPVKKPMTPDAPAKRSKRAVNAVPGQHPRKPLAKAHLHVETTTPLAPPPDMVCPSCDRPLSYECSHIGGASGCHVEQWDDYTCPGSCGTFQYRQRTQMLRRVDDSDGRNPVADDVDAAAGRASSLERRRFRSDAEMRAQQVGLERQWNERQSRRRIYAIMLGNQEEP